MHEKTDRDLLSEYVRGGNQAAFEELVCRHMSLVRHAAGRILSSDWADDVTDDIAQAVFLALHEKAEALARRSLRNRIEERLGVGRGATGGSLAGWIHDAACKAALRLRRDTLRYRARITAAGTERRSQETGMREELVMAREATEHEVRERLDALLGTLPAAQREALVLHYFEGKTRGEIAALMGCPEGTAARRVNAGLEKLRKRFRREGLIVSSVLLLSCLESERTIAAVGVADVAGELAGGAGEASSASASVDAARSVARNVLQQNVSEQNQRLAKEIGQDMAATQLAHSALMTVAATFFISAGAITYVSTNTGTDQVSDIVAKSLSGETATGSSRTVQKHKTALEKQAPETGSVPSSSRLPSGTEAEDVGDPKGGKAAKRSFSSERPPAGAKVAPVRQGSLRAINDHGAVLDCPLKHTAVNAQIDGFIASVEVTQHFRNPTTERIEAIYIFPLPENSAVDRMVMQIGERQVVGEIHVREQARAIYEQAKAAGRKAALLEQERPNIFTQNVANIGPGEEILVTLRYNQKLKYDDGTYRFSFPMTVGHRYTGAQLDKDGQAVGGGGTADVSRIVPPRILAESRNGHDISLSIHLSAAVSLSGVECKSHVVSTHANDERSRDITLSSADSIPNKDFMLEYAVAGEKPEVGVVTAWNEPLGGGYCLIMVQPKKAPRPEEMMPKELIFIIDTSGSMGGLKIEAAKKAMKHCIRNLNPRDTFEFFSFASCAKALFGRPVPSTPENLNKALAYIDSLKSGGGTNLLQPMDMALSIPESPSHLRMLCLMTDGGVGSEGPILARVKDPAKLGNARIFTFGVGCAPNHYIIERMAELGRGAAEYIRPDTPSAEAVQRFYGRIRNPYLTHIELAWEGVEVKHVLPTRIPDLYAGQPLMIVGRYTEPGVGKLTLKGKLAGQDYSQTVDVDLTDSQTGNPALPSVWAREQIRELENSNLNGRNPAARGAITELALTYELMSQYTSFVAVDEEISPDFDGTMPKSVRVPAYLPQFMLPQFALPQAESGLLLGKDVGVIADDDLDIGGMGILNRLRIDHGKASEAPETTVFLLDAIDLPSAKPTNSVAGKQMDRRKAPLKTEEVKKLQLYSWQLANTPQVLPVDGTRRFHAAGQRGPGGKKDQYFGYMNGKELKSLAQKAGKDPGRQARSGRALYNRTEEFLRKARQRKKVYRASPDGGFGYDDALENNKGNYNWRGDLSKTANMLQKLLNQNERQLRKEKEEAFGTKSSKGVADEKKANALIARLLVKREDEARSSLGLHLVGDLIGRTGGKEKLSAENIAGVQALVANGKTPAVRSRALLTLWRVQGNDALPSFRLALSDTDAGVRLLAFRLSLSCLEEKPVSPKKPGAKGKEPTATEQKKEEQKPEGQVQAAPRERADLVRKALADEAREIRALGLHWSLRLDAATAFELLAKSAREEKAPELRALTAEVFARGALLDKKPLPREKVAEELERLIRKDDDAGVFVASLKGLGSLGVLSSVADRLAEKMAVGDAKKEQYALLTAANALVDIAETRRQAKKKADSWERVVGHLLTVLGREDRKVKLPRTPSHTVDLALKVAALHACIGQTNPQLLDLCGKLIEPKGDVNLRRAAMLVAAHAGEAGAELAVPMLNDALVLNDPKLGTKIILSARGTKMADTVAAKALELLKGERPKTVGVSKVRDYELFRAALLEAVVDQGVKKGGLDADTLKLIAKQMKADSSWRVRRAALCGFARLGDRQALPHIISALDDPHAVVQHLALATGVAFTAKDAEARAKHLKRLSRGPQPATYREMCRTEGLDYDRLAVNRAEARKILRERAGM